MKRAINRENFHKAAFSLVEIIVVVGILAILMVSIFPAYRQMTAAGQKTKCLSSLSQIYTGVQMYANDNQGVIPYAYIDANTNHITWTVAVKDYVPIQGWGINQGVTCPAGPSGSSFSKYGINAWLSYTVTKHTRPPRITDVQSMTTTAFIFDSGGEVMEKRTALDPNASRWYIPGYSANTNISSYYAPNPAMTKDAHQGRHNRTINMIMVDGHAENMPVEYFVTNNATWTIKWNSDPTR